MPLVGSRGDSYDNALFETITGLYKPELIHSRASWRTRDTVELATLECAAWFNGQRLFESIVYIPPAEAGADCCRQLATPATMGLDLNQTASTKAGAVQLGAFDLALIADAPQICPHMPLAYKVSRRILAHKKSLISLGFPFEIRLLLDVCGFARNSADGVMVERRRIELPTFALRTRRSPS